MIRTLDTYDHDICTVHDIGPLFITDVLDPIGDDILCTCSGSDPDVIHSPDVVQEVELQPFTL